MTILVNPKHEAFCQAYVRGESAGNASATYRAVYGKDNRGAATRLQQRDSIVQRVAEIRAEIAASEAAALAQATESLGISKEWVLERLLENVERAMQRKAVLDDEGEAVGEWKYDGSVANKALELLGKHLGMFVSVGDTHNLQVNLGVAFVDKPPVETRAEWEARRRQELLPRPGNGKPHS